MIAELHKEVPVSVPMSFVHDPSLLSTAQYYRLMGFKERDGVNPGDPKVWLGGREGSRLWEGRREQEQQDEGGQEGAAGSRRKGRKMAGEDEAASSPWCGALPHETCEAFPPVQQFRPPAPARLPCRQVFESPDDLLHRVEGLMLLYGAIVQV